MATQVDELNKLINLTEQEPEDEIIDDEEIPAGEEGEDDKADRKTPRTKLTASDNINIEKAQKFIRLAISNDVNDRATMEDVARKFFHFILDQIPAEGTKKTLMRTLGAEFMKDSREQA